MSSMFELALSAGIPVIGVQTDDPVYFETTLKNLSGMTIRRWDKPKSLGQYLYWTDDSSQVTPEVYQQLQSGNAQLVVANPAEFKNLIFDAGVMPTPEALARVVIAKMTSEEWVDKLYPVLRGLSLKTIREILLLTQARAGNAAPHEVRRTRASMFGATQGLYLEDTTYDFYVCPDELRAWLDLNAEYFHKQAHAKLIPRGLMFEGPPGVGKSMAAKAIANELKVPLYRFDIASTLDKYIGVSESRVAKLLAIVDREAPCVLLLDEVEKIFKSQDDSGVITRLLSQLLWWLAEHQSRVFTVMTTNDKSGIPPELYRKGRIDNVFSIGRLSLKDARTFAIQVFESVVGAKPGLGQVKKIQESLINSGSLFVAQAEPQLAHADAAETVYTLIKENKWA